MLALVVQAVAVTGLAVLPLLETQSMEAGKRFLILSPAPERPEPRHERPAPSRAAAPSPFRVLELTHLISHPVLTPRVGPLPLTDAPTLPGSLASPGDGSIAGIPGGLGSALSVAPPATLPVKPRPPALRLSSTVSQSQLLFGPKPVYPRLAVSSRIEGTVRLQATISREGVIENLHVLSGHPLLTGPAIEAVKRWRYRPVILNGDPVEVITEIDVNFTLHE